MSAWPPDNGLRTSFTGHIGRTILSLMGAQSIASWDVLRRRLGSPQTILCLGNGPSSESQVVRDLGFDCLFRVNWVWNDRARHANPSLVFTADLDPPPEGNAPIICFPTREDANRILASYARRRVGLPAAYLVFPELASAPAGKTWSHRPTNGALMVAAAAQLRPRRLVIAGIDLYQHPDGKYPGSVGETNDYDAIHHRDIDLAFICAALNQFDGEAAILSEQLRAALEA